MERERVEHVVGSLPKPWEVERGFDDALYEWMGRAPWFAISAALHGVVILVMLAIPWDLLGEPNDPPVVITSELTQESPDEFVDPPLPTPPELDKPVSDEPTLLDSTLPEVDVPTAVDDASDAASDGENLSDQPFTAIGDVGVIGLGANGGGPIKGHRGDNRARTGIPGVGTERPLTNSLLWLASHQSADGSWDCDGFSENCGRLHAGSTCDGPGEATHDVGMTGLALLAFLGDGSSTRAGRNRDNVARGVRWLKDQQDSDLGVYGERVGHSFLYDHSIATLAMCEAYYFSRSPLLARTAQDAVNFLTRARNPYGAWRYDYPPSGENDTSITGWCVFALASAKDAGLEIDPEAFVGASQWIDDVTDPATGRTGYDAIGSASSRVNGLNDQYPTDKGEAMTAVALLSRVFMGQDVESDPRTAKAADLLRARLPEWDPDGLGNDFYYWYYGSYALFQLGGPRWDAWNQAAKKALIGHQRQDGDAIGSWDPKDAWGHAGGRVYTTALGALCLEVYFRYSRVLGGR